MNKKYGIALAILILLTPIGLLAEGTAWGEWGAEEIEEILGFVPSGMQNFPLQWGGIFPDYGVPGLENTFFEQSAGYIGSAIIGCALIGIVFYLLKICLKNKNNQSSSTQPR